jgi:cytidyltransferase-like protein
MIKTSIFAALLMIAAFIDCTPKRVMVFGVFDLFHPGHNSFLTQAQEHGESLYVVATRDAMVQQLKKKKPLQDEVTRKANLEKVQGVFKVILGDEVLGAYSVIKEYLPDVICLGYDQQGLEADLQRAMRVGDIKSVELIKLKPFKPEVFHTSLIRSYMDAYGIVDPCLVLEHYQ